MAPATMAWKHWLIIAPTSFVLNVQTKLTLGFCDIWVTSGEYCSITKILFEAIDKKIIDSNLYWEGCIDNGLNNTDINIGR